MSEASRKGQDSGPQPEIPDDGPSALRGQASGTWFAALRARFRRRRGRSAEKPSGVGEAAAAETPQGRKTFRLRIPTMSLADMRALAINGITLFVMLALVISVVREASRDRVLIDPIDVPGDLKGIGYSPTVVAHRLMDEMLEIRRQATTRKEGREVSPEWTQPDIDVPGTGVTFKSLLGIVKNVLGLQDTRIGGEIVRVGEGEDKAYHLRIRIYGIGAVSGPPPGKDLDRLLALGARSLMKAVDPYYLASYLSDFEDEREAALETIAHCLTTPPRDDDPWAYLLWGLLLHREGEFAGAVEKYSAALDLRPGFALALTNWGAALHEQDRYFDAMEKYREAIDIDPDFAAAHYHWGLTLYAVENYREADAKYRKAAELDRENPRIYFDWGLALGRLNKLDAAIEMFRKALIFDPWYEEAYFNRGVAFYMQKKYPEASAMYEKAASLGGENPNIQKFWRVALRDWQERLSEQGEDDEAIKEGFDQAVRKYEEALALGEN